MQRQHSGGHDWEMQKADLTPSEHLDAAISEGGPTGDVCAPVPLLLFLVLWEGLAHSLLPFRAHPSHLRACTRLRSVNSCRSTKAWSTARFSSSLGGQGQSHSQEGVWEAGGNRALGRPCRLFGIAAASAVDESSGLGPSRAWHGGRDVQNTPLRGPRVATTLLWWTFAKTIPTMPDVHRQSHTPQMPTDGPRAPTEGPPCLPDVHSPYISQMPIDGSQASIDSPHIPYLESSTHLRCPHNP